MAPLLHASKRPLGSSCIAGWIRASLDGLAAGRGSGSSRNVKTRIVNSTTRIVNSTGSTVVLRSKYRVVWEEARFRLRQGESVVVRWAPDKPYERLGAFVVETRNDEHFLQPTASLLLIGQSAIASNQEIVLSRSKSSNHYEMTMVGRKSSSRKHYEMTMVGRKSSSRKHYPIKCK